MRRIFAIWALCLCWGVLNAAPLGPFNATLLEKLKTDYQKGDKEVIQYIELQEKAAEKYIKMSPLSVTAKKKLPPSKGPPGLYDSIPILVAGLHEDRWASLYP